jgi:hypothetical protein
VSVYRDAQTALNYSDVPLNRDGPEDVPLFAEKMSAVWRAAFAGALAPIAYVTGLSQKRATRLLSGHATPTRQEAAVLDSALGVDASRHFPTHSNSVVQSQVAVPQTLRSRGADLTEARRARIAKWSELVAKYGRGRDALAEETRIPRPRLENIVTSGARMSHEESVKMTAVLGPRLS